MISIKSIGHGAAVALNNAHKFLLGAEKVVENLAGNKALQATVEGVTAVTLGPKAVDVERSAFAVAGEVAGLLQAVNSADNAKKLLDLGFDKQVIEDFKAVLSALPKI